MSRASKRQERKAKKQPKQESRIKERQVRNNEPLTGRNQIQVDYIESILNNVQTFAIGPAGAGKTFIPATIAADMLLDGTINKIILCRPAVEAEEWHGFLPGGIIDKMAPWVKPFTDVIERRVGKSDYRRFLNDGAIEIVPFAFMRGLTFNDAFVILDEAQNSTTGQMKLFLTRIGENVRVVVNGDLSQKDIKGQSGLEAALGIASYGLPNTGIVRFTMKEVVRSETCQAWVDAYEKAKV